jgi:hypothetical protein
MRRRDFIAGVGSALVASAARPFSGLVVAQASQPAAAEGDPDPAGGYTLRPPRQFLFTDLRHIDPSDLAWRSPDGKSIPVAGPPDPPVPAIADLGRVPRGIRLVAQPAAKEGPVENLPGRVIHADGLYRSWTIQTKYPSGKNLGSYSAAPAEAIAVRCGESKDGYAWTWRDAGEIKVSDVTGIDGEFFFIDPHAAPDERFKCIYNARVLSDVGPLWEQYRKIHPRHRDLRLNHDYIYCLFGMVSPDGLAWKPISEPLMVHKGDTDNTVYYDEWLGKYVLYTRLYWMQRRMIARAESDDFRRWTPVDPIVSPGLEDPVSFDVYTNGRTCYPGLPEHHLMFPLFYRRYTQTAEIHLHSSLDGIRWDRVPGGPVLTPGDPGAWDGEFIGAGKDLVPLGKDRIAIPYSGSTHPHKSPRWPGVISSATGWASWPKGRLCAIRADEEGQFSTFGVEITGQQLKINARVRRAGEIRIGLIGTNGRSVGECDPITGDSLAHPVTWKGDSALRRDRGQTVILHFALRAADLFGFEWV